MIPNCTLKIYDASDVLQYTIVNDAVSVITHAGLNEDLGFFNIQLPTALSGTYRYYDIAQNWTVKAWFGYAPIDTSGLPNFAGKVYQTTTSNLPQGYTRLITGKSLGEILQRRIKMRRVYTALDASTIVAVDVATELGIYDAAKVAADTTDITMTIDAENYLDMLKRISDYWYNAGTQVKKDYYVDVEKELVWKARPIRTTGVETLTFGQNIIDYNIVRDGTQIKNHIQVYGRKVPFVGVNDTNNKFLAYQIYGRKYPTDGDSLTHGAGWVDIKGVTSSQSATPSPQVGVNYTQSDSEDVGNQCEFYRTLADQISCEGYDGYSAIEFWSMRYGAATGTIQLFCDDSSNYYEAALTYGAVDNTWKFNRYSLGMANTYNAATNPTGQWTATGTPDWENISGIYFYAATGLMDGYVGLDGLCFNFGRWRYMAEDTGGGSSQALYDIHDSVIINDLLNSDAECETHGKTLLYQQKDPVTRLDLVLIGNTNVLLGDQIPITIPPENISAQNFYVTSVEQHWGKAPEGWQTVSTLVDTLNTRNVPSASVPEVILKELKRQREIGKGRLNKIT